MKNKEGQKSGLKLKTTWRFLQALLGIVIFLVLWHMLSLTTRSIPTPFETIKRLVTIWPTEIKRLSFTGHILTSLLRVFIALVLGCLVGIPLGVWMGWNKKFRAIIKPLFETIRPVPPLAMVPLFTLWFGANDLARVMIVFFGVLMPITVNASAGVEMVPPINIDVGRIFGADKRILFFDVVMPSSIPAILAGVRLALSSGFAVLLAAEMISARSGIGFLIISGSNFGDLGLSIVGMIVLGLMGALFAICFDLLERRLCPWMR